MLYMALIAFMRDYCPAQDYNIGGLLKLLSMAKASESNENYKSPLDLIFDEIETGMRRVKRNPKNPEVKERAAQNPTPSDAPEEISVYTGAEASASTSSRRPSAVIRTTSDRMTTSTRTESAGSTPPRTTPWRTTASSSPQPARRSSRF